ncbi:MAG: hypothetical protein ACOYN0_04470 [Phycisphaerales bacterium]
MKISAAIAALASACVIAPLASADILAYRTTFESGALGSEWSANSVINSEVRSTFSRFNGRYSTGYTQLTLPSLPALRPPSGPGGGGESGGGGAGGAGNAQWYEVTLAFDFYCIDSWDGSTSFGPDRFRVLANGTQILRNTFTNQPGNSDDYPVDPDQFGQLGFHPRWSDSIYRGITRTIEYSGGDPLVFRWMDEGLQGMGDESWGIDNVSVSYRLVPAPAAGALPLLGALFATRRRRA